MKEVTNLAIGVGRRKTSVARVYIRKGKGELVVNGKEVEKYFSTGERVSVVRQPLSVTDSKDKFFILINVVGGGTTGQAEACRHGIARALCIIDENNRMALKSNGYLTRDSRMVERKKPGQRKARRKFQFSKR